MNINNTKVYDLAESIVASGYPMLTEYMPSHVDSVVACVKAYLDSWLTTACQEYEKEAKPHVDRAIRLASAKDGSGHKTFLSGILVSMDVTASNAWWLQFGRYHFAQIVSSQSKMHRLKQLAINANATELLDEDTIKRIKDNLKLYEDRLIDEETFIYSCPIGLQLTARVTTNYLQLRTIYMQRRNHKLEEWKKFCNWIQNLPMANYFIVGKDN